MVPEALVLGMSVRLLFLKLIHVRVKGQMACGGLLIHGWRDVGPEEFQGIGNIGAGSIIQGILIHIEGWMMVGEGLQFGGIG